MAKAQVTVPLNIPDVKVIKTEYGKDGEIIITIRSTKKGTCCRKCDQWITESKGYDEWISVRHLEVFGRPSYLRYRPRRYYCERCKTSTTQRLEWQEPYSPHTMAYDDHVLVQLVNATIEDVSIKENLSYDKVLGVLERRISTQAEWHRYSALPTLGIDEIAIKKGQSDYVTLVTARLSNQHLAILGVIPTRQKDQVIAFLRSIPMRLLETVNTVCCDMYEGFTEAIKAEVPNANIVVDRFHVARHYRDATDQVRKQELARLKKSLPDEAYRELKGCMWAFRKNPDNLTTQERKVLKRFFSYSSAAKLAYQLREQLTEIFNQQISKSIAKRKLRSWIKRVKKSGLSCFDAFINTLHNWWNEITNYFIDRSNSGFVEGFNNRVKVLKRRCYGLFNIQHIFQRIFLDLEGYRLLAFHPLYMG